MKTDALKQFQQKQTPESFEQIVKEYIPFVRKLMYRMALNESDADDLTQEVFIQVYRHLPGFRGESKLSTWLYRIAFNTAKSFLRRKSRTPVQALDIVPDVAGPDADRPDVSLSGLETDQAVTEALNSLPLKLRAAIILTAIEGMNYDEAASIEGCPKPTFYWRVHKARQLLKQRLKEYL